MADLDALSSTEDLFRTDSYLRATEATVLAVTPDGLILDRTVLYAAGGGQPGDGGSVTGAEASARVEAAVYHSANRKLIVHPVTDAARFRTGETVTVEVDWERRYRYMRMHTCLHLLSVVLPYPVTGGQIGVDDGRLDFDIPDAGLDKDEITAKVLALVSEDHPVSMEWITDAELDANPGLVKTMSVQPPRGSGRVRLVRIGSIDLQPCGGTHVAETREVGAISVTKIEKKGSRNRRVRVSFV